MKIPALPQLLLIGYLLSLVALLRIPVVFHKTLTPKRFRAKYRDPSKPCIAWKKAAWYKGARPTETNTPFRGVTNITKPYGVRSTASCYRYTYKYSPPPPHDGHNCGFWALYDHTTVIGLTPLTLKVAMSGKIKHYQWGVRAEKQHVLEAWCWMTPRKARELREYHHIPVHPYPNLRRISWFWIVVYAMPGMAIGMAALIGGGS